MTDTYSPAKKISEQILHIESRNRTENGKETYIKTIKVVSKFGRASVKQTTSDESLSNDGDGFIGLLPKKKEKIYSNHPE